VDVDTALDIAPVDEGVVAKRIVPDLLVSLVFSHVVGDEA